MYSSLSLVLVTEREYFPRGMTKCQQTLVQAHGLKLTRNSIHSMVFGTSAVNAMSSPNRIPHSTMRIKQWLKLCHR